MTNIWRICMAYIQQIYAIHCKKMIDRSCDVPGCQTKATGFFLDDDGNAVDIILRCGLHFG